MSRPPLWRTTDHVRATSDPLPAEPVDDLVVGAGVTGLTTALLLSRSGRKVAVVEAGDDVAALTTGRTTGKVSLLQGVTLSRLARTVPQSVVTAYVDANREGLAWIRRFCSDHDVAVQLREALTYAQTEADLDQVRAEHEVAARAGLPVTWRDRPELPFESFGATALPDQLQLDPVELCHALTTEIRRHEGTVSLGQRVDRVAWSEPRVRVSDGRELVGATLTLATGSPIVDRGLHFARMTAERSYIAAFEWDGPDLPMAISPSPYGSIRDGFAPYGRRVVLVGGGSHPVGRAVPTSDRTAELSRWAQGRLGVGEPIAAWSAQDYTTTDRLPSVGRVPGAPRTFAATGFAKWGLTNGVAAARTISAHVLGQDVLWDRAARRPRPPGLAAAGRLVQHNTEVGTQMVSGWTRAAVGRTDCGVRAVCTHLGGVLRWNDVEQSWDCPLHGSRFGEDGRVLEGPATRPLCHGGDTK